MKAASGRCPKPRRRPKAFGNRCVVSPSAPRREGASAWRRSTPSRLSRRDKGAEQHGRGDVRIADETHRRPGPDAGEGRVAADAHEGEQEGRDHQGDGAIAQPRVHHLAVEDDEERRIRDRHRHGGPVLHPSGTSRAVARRAKSDASRGAVGCEGRRAARHRGKSPVTVPRQTGAARARILLDRRAASCARHAAAIRNRLRAPAILLQCNMNGRSDGD